MSTPREELMIRCQKHGLGATDMQRMSNLSLEHWLAKTERRDMDEVESQEHSESPFVTGMRDERDHLGVNDEHHHGHDDEEFGEDRRRPGDLGGFHLDEVDVDSRTIEHGNNPSSSWQDRRAYHEAADDDHVPAAMEEEAYDDDDDDDDNDRSVRTNGKGMCRSKQSTPSGRSQHNAPDDEQDTSRAKTRHVPNRTAATTSAAITPRAAVAASTIIPPVKQRTLTTAPVIAERDPMLPSNEAYEAFVQQSMPAFSAPPALQMYEQLQQKFDKPSAQIMEHPVMREFMKSFGSITSTFGHVQQIQQHLLYPQLISPCLDDQERELFQKSNALVTGNPTMYVLDATQVPAGAIENPVYVLYKAQEKLVYFLTQLLAARQSLPKILRPEHHGNVMAKEQLLASLRRAQDHKLFYLSECIQNLARDASQPHNALFAQALGFLQTTPIAFISTAQKTMRPTIPAADATGASLYRTAPTQQQQQQPHQMHPSASYFGDMNGGMNHSAAAPFHPPQQHQQRAYSMNYPVTNQHQPYYSAQAAHPRNTFGF